MTWAFLARTGFRLRMHIHVLASQIPHEHLTPGFFLQGYEISNLLICDVN